MYMLIWISQINLYVMYIYSFVYIFTPTPVHCPLHRCHGGGRAGIHTHVIHLIYLYMIYVFTNIYSFVYMYTPTPLHCSLHRCHREGGADIHVIHIYNTYILTFRYMIYIY